MTATIISMLLVLTTTLACISGLMMMAHDHRDLWSRVFQVALALMVGELLIGFVYLFVMALEELML